MLDFVCCDRPTPLPTAVLKSWSTKAIDGPITAVKLFTLASAALMAEKAQAGQC